MTGQRVDTLFSRKVPNDDHASMLNELFCSPGFNTAVSTATEAMDRIRTTAASHHRVMLVVIKGRNAGWLTLNAAAASGADIVLIPEIEFDLEAACARYVERSKRHKAYTIITAASMKAL